MQFLYGLVRTYVKSLAWLPVLLLCSLLAHADERILAFDSDIRIAADASMEVTETIRVRAEGTNIRRGIYREIPTRYRDRFGNAFRVDIEVTAVTRDGQPEPYDVRQRGNGLRIDLGNDDFLAVPADYEYTIHYRTSRQIGYFDDHDELYWNVTGNGWSFVIDAAGATVALPVAVPAGDLVMEGYTGRFGDRGQDYVASVEDGQGSISTTSALAPNAGLTLVLSWPKGIVAQPDTTQRVGYLLADNRGLLLALLTLAGVAVYLVRSWSRAGRDPEPGVIFPHYDPPAGYSPAAARYIRKMSYDSKALTAAIINLAVKGHLRIIQDDHKYSLQKESSGVEMAAAENALLDKLFADGAIVELNNKNHAIIGSAMSAHAKSLKQQYQGIYFANNTKLLLPSMVGSVAMLFLILFTGGFVPLVIAVFVVIVILHGIFAWLLKAPTPKGRQLMDTLDGFRQYLEVAEKDELNLRNPPAMTPELFERYLPFAIALGVEQAWAEKFAASLASLHAPQDAMAYQPLWYAGQFNAGRIGDFTNSVSKSFTTAISSAATPPGSASGAGGGGFSGGGGGGGGGGGR